MKKLFFISNLLFSLFVSPLALAEMVNINKADVAALESLDGIGKKKAEAIVAYRTEHGEFKTLDELKEVPGIGDKLFEKIKDSIALADEGNTPATAKDVAEPAKADKADAKPADKAVDKTAEKPNTPAKTDKVSEKTAEKADKT